MHQSAASSSPSPGLDVAMVMIGSMHHESKQHSLGWWVESRVRWVEGRVRWVEGRVRWVEAR